jgi:hypothetical protein
MHVRLILLGVAFNDATSIDEDIVVVKVVYMRGGCPFCRSTRRRFHDCSVFFQQVKESRQEELAMKKIKCTQSNM